MHKKRNFQGSRKLPQAHEKVDNENETNKQRKYDVCKTIIDGRKHFIRHIRKAAEGMVF